MFNNAMLFNPPDDWIHQAAKSLKKSVVKKIETASSAAERAYRGNRGRQNRSMYVYDDDSDQDMYEYESDQDEEYGGGRRKRKRDNRASTNKDEPAARPLEHTIRLHHVLKDGNDLRGPFSDFPINTDGNTFSMPADWSCRKREAGTETFDPRESTETNTSADLSEEGMKKQELAREMADLLALQKALGDNEVHNLRRSTRAQHEGVPGVGSGSDVKITDLEYFSSGYGLDGSSSRKPAKQPFRCGSVARGGSRGALFQVVHGI